MKILKAIISALRYFVSFEFLDDFEKEIKKPEPLPEPIATTTPIAEVPTPLVKTPRERLYDMAKATLWYDASPKDIAGDELACVESVDTIHLKAFGTFINNTKTKVTVSTIEAFRVMSKSPFWKEVTSPLAGDCILSVTGTGNGRVSNGHIGVVGNYGIMSNDSMTGIWRQNYTLQSWVSYFQIKGGFKTHFFRRI